jgi:hypothetical protein
VQRREPLIARPNLIVPRLFEMPEEGEHTVEAQVGHREPREPAAALRGDEAQEEAQGVAVALDGGGAQALERREVLDEERVEQRAQRGRRHGCTSGSVGAAQRSNR